MTGEPRHPMWERVLEARTGLNATTGDLDLLVRLAEARREAKAIAASLLGSRTSKKEQREDFGRRLNALAASLGTVELYLSGETRDEGVPSGVASPESDKPRCVHCGAEVWWSFPRPKDTCAECGKPISGPVGESS